MYSFLYEVMNVCIYFSSVDFFMGGFFSKKENFQFAPEWQFKRNALTHIMGILTYLFSSNFLILKILFENEFIHRRIDVINTFLCLMCNSLRHQFMQKTFYV